MTDTTRGVIRDMVGVATAPDTTADEREAALDTIAEALEPTEPIDLTDDVTH